MSDKQLFVHFESTCRTRRSGSAPSSRRDPVARRGARRRLEPGRSTGLDPGHVPVLGRAYDWRDRESRLNRFDHYITAIDEVDIHFVHQRSPHPDARPLVITHGWPGSIVEFHKVIEPLDGPNGTRR